MERARKALIAALGAFATGLITALVNGDKPETNEGWVGLIGGCLGLALAAGVATYKVRNVGSNIGPTGSTTTGGSTIVR